METAKPDFSKIGKSNVSRSKRQERSIANALAEWSGVDFRRRRVTGREHAVTMVELAADVIPVEGKFIFSVEAKCGKGFSWEAMLGSLPTCKYTEWWHQTCFDCQLVSESIGRRLFPLLFFKPTFNTLWLGISAHAVSLLRPKQPTSDHRYYGSALWFPHCVFDEYEWAGPITCNVSHTKKAANRRMVSLVLDPVVFCRWRDFAEAVDPESAFERE